jgi:hypothetical protein
VGRKGRKENGSDPIIFTTVGISSEEFKNLKKNLSA